VKVPPVAFTETDPSVVVHPVGEADEEVTVPENAGAGGVVTLEVSEHPDPSETVTL
jgi:hypothetical protein